MRITAKYLVAGAFALPVAAGLLMLGEGRPAAQEDVDDGLMALRRMTRRLGAKNIWK